MDAIEMMELAGLVPVVVLESVEDALPAAKALV